MNNRKTTIEIKIKATSKGYSEQEVFLLTAMVTEGIRFVDHKHSGFLDDNGHPPFYDLMLSIVDDLLFDTDSEYQKYLSATDKDNWFHKHHDTCMDWYFMNEMTAKLKVALKGWEDEGIEIDSICAQLKDKEIDGETTEQLLKNINMHEQMLRQLIMSADMKDVLALVLEKEQISK